MKMNHHVSHVFLILNYIACLHKLLLKCNAALTCRIRVLCAYITAQMRIDVVGQNIHIGHDFILRIFAPLNRVMPSPADLSM